MHPTLEKRLRGVALAGAVAVSSLYLGGCGALDAVSGTSSRQRYYEHQIQQMNRQGQQTQSSVHTTSQGQGWKLYTAKKFDALQALPEDVKDHFSTEEEFVIVVNNRGSVNARFKIDIFNAQGKKVEDHDMAYPGRNEGFTVKYVPGELQPGGYTYSAYNEQGFIGKGSFTIVIPAKERR
jgi:outer membrane murein-binding lipoprotein Lpp